MKMKAEKSYKVKEPTEADTHQGKWDMQTLMDAEDIKSNPEKMKGVMKHMKTHMARIKSIQDLKDAYDAKYGEGRISSGKRIDNEGAAHEGKESKKKEKKEDATGVE